MKTILIILLIFIFSTSCNDKQYVVITKTRYITDRNWCKYTYYDNTGTYHLTEDSCSRYNVLDSLKINY